jgi:hypothetical protein
VINHNSRTAQELHRLPPRTLRRHQPDSFNHPIKQQQVFGNVVTTVYASILRDLQKGKDARFAKVDRGQFTLAGKR